MLQILEHGKLGLRARTLDFDRKIENAISSGERNRETMQLVRNWCGHARIEKFGGTGLVQLETGLPVGHHSLQCDHAPADSIASWDLRDAVLDFYDRHCSTCQKRDPVRFPNIQLIVAERDRKRAEQTERNIARAIQTKEADRRRGEARESLKARLDPVGQAIVDDIGTYDSDRSPENLDRLVIGARLAPERFPAPLVDYIFQFAEEEWWFAGAGLAILAELNVDSIRLAQLAMSTLARDGTKRDSAEIALRLVEYINADSVKHALPMVIELANPNTRALVGIPNRSTVVRPELLEALWVSHQTTILDGITTLLESRRRELVEHAGRGLSALQAHDSKAMLPILERVVSTFVHAGLCVDDLDGDDDYLPNLTDAIVSAFENSPEAVASTLDRLAQDPDSVSKVRAFEVYAKTLRVSQRGQGIPVPLNSRPHRIALSRLIWIPTTSRDRALIRIVLSVFQGRPGRLVNVARAEIESLVSATFLLADRLAEVDLENHSFEDPQLASMERLNRQMMLRQLISAYLDWAAIAARGNGRLAVTVTRMLDDIPENRDELRGLALGMIQHLADDVDTLHRFLPYLYQSIVGPSVSVRSYAATALGKVPRGLRSNVPRLVFEAFCVLLRDPHVVVHQAAVRVLPRLAVPRVLRRDVALAALDLAEAYRHNSSQDSFLVECVLILARMLDEFGQLSTKLRAHLVEVLKDVDPQILKYELWSLSYHFRGEPSFACLVARTLPYMVYETNTNRMADILNDLNPKGVIAYSTELKKAGLAVAREHFWLAAQVLETVAQAGEADLARRFADEIVEAFDDNELYRSRKTAARFLALAAAIENAIATDNGECLSKYVQNWKENEKVRDTDREKQRERHTRASLPSAD